MKILEPDGPLVQSVDRAKDMVILNFWTVLLCLPVVTAGASLTAMHTMCLKMVREEEGYMTKGFFDAFRRNFKQATFVWLLLLALTAFVGADFYAINRIDAWFCDVARVTLTTFTVCMALTATFLFPMLSKFECSTRQLIINSFKAGLIQFPRAILMIAINVLPFVIFYFVNVLIPLIFIISVSVSGMLNARLYDKFFEKMEAPFKEKNDRKDI